ncbi:MULTISPECIES: hypothetical protein [unclassified Coleofasciculus]|nr:MULTISPECIES: hypothetical protein [unclassified Coleofasciculus]
MRLQTSFVQGDRYLQKPAPIGGIKISSNFENKRAIALKKPYSN